MRLARARDAPSRPASGRKTPTRGAPRREVMTITASHSGISVQVRATTPPVRRSCRRRPGRQVDNRKVGHDHARHHARGRKGRRKDVEQARAEGRDRRTTGVAGQQFVAALQNHPWFRITTLAASERSANKSYGDALRTERRRPLVLRRGAGPKVLALPVIEASTLDPSNIDIVFTAVERRRPGDRAAAREARAGVSPPRRRSATRPTFPIAVPGVNLEHLDLVDTQRRDRGWKGFVVPLPNCTTMGMVVTLKPLLDAFGVKHVIMTSMQGLSGAGRSPGVAALDVLDKHHPVHRRRGEGRERRPARSSAACRRERSLRTARWSRRRARAPTSAGGHTEAVQVQLERDTTLDRVRAALEEFGRDFCSRGLPSAPRRMISLHDDPFRLQPRSSTARPTAA